MPRTRLLAAIALLTTSLLAGCGDNGNNAITPVVPTVYIKSLTPSVGAAWEFAPDGPPAALVMPCDGKVAVAAGTTDFTVKPPGGCGETLSCGHVLLSTSLSDQTEGALQTPVLFQLDPAFSGTATFTAALVHDDASSYLDDQMEPIVQTLEVSFDAAVGCE
jgi:hypothetical protein